MTEAELLSRVENLRREPLQVCCCTPAGEIIVASVEECARQHCRYFHIVADDLDRLLDSALNHK